MCRRMRTKLVFLRRLDCAFRLPEPPECGMYIHWSIIFGEGTRNTSGEATLGEVLRKYQPSLLRNLAVLSQR